MFWWFISYKILATSLNNQQLICGPTLIDLNPDDGLNYYPFLVSCDTLNHLYTRICILNKIEDVKLRLFNMIADINETNIFVKQILNVNANFRLKNWNSDECQFDRRNTKIYK